MFFNLVHIELIRLIRNRSLKFSIPVGLFMLVCCVGIAEFGFDRMLALRIELNQTIYGYEVLASLILAFYEVGAVLVAAISSIFVTCDYCKFRLAVNIEGVERNRFKLYLSEIVGILIFVFISCLMGVPVAIIGSLFGGQGSILSSAGCVELIKGYIEVALTFCLIGGIICVTGHIVSRLFKSKTVAFTFVGIATPLYLMILITAAGFVKGVNEASIYAVNVERIIGAAMIVLSLIPLLVNGVALVIKERKSDRL